jgi:hypothetical protein
MKHGIDLLVASLAALVFALPLLVTAVPANSLRAAQRRSGRCDLPVLTALGVISDFG